MDPSELRAILKVFFSPWVLLGAVGTALILAATGAGILYSLRSPSPSGSTLTLVVTRLPASSATPPPLMLTPSPFPQATPTAPSTPTAPPGAIPLGASVQISGTGGDGLNLRAEPGLKSKINYLGLEAEVFIVQDGPVENDGLSWYFLVGFHDESRSGWAASNYLEIVQPP